MEVYQLAGGVEPKLAGGGACGWPVKVRKHGEVLGSQRGRRSEAVSDESVDAAATVFQLIPDDDDDGGEWLGLR